MLSSGYRRRFFIRKSHLQGEFHYKRMLNKVLKILLKMLMFKQNLLRKKIVKQRKNFWNLKNGKSREYSNREKMQEMEKKIKDKRKINLMKN